MNPFEQANQALRVTEAALVDSYEAELGRELGVTDSACVLLLTLLLSIERESGTLDLDEEGRIVQGDVRLILLMAQMYIGVRALRTIRAARAVLAAGYEPEARALDRILVELQAHRTAILADPTGREALAWLQGERTRNISARVRAMAPSTLYKNLSQDSHGDPTPVGRLFDQESEAIQLEPRRGIPTRASLLMYAGFARDQAVITAQLAGLDLGGVSDLDEEIRTAQAALEKDHARLTEPKDVT